MKCKQWSIYTIQRFKNTAEFLEYGRNIVENKILDHDINDAKYDDEKYNAFLYSYSSAATIHDKRAKKKSYVGITYNMMERLTKHRMNIGEYLATGKATVLCDERLAEATIEDFLWYCHIIVPGIIEKRGPSAMICMKAVFGK